MAAVEPCCARKLVEQATQYAQGLGFAPHPDYKKGAPGFGGLHVEQCAQHVYLLWPNPHSMVVAGGL
jgi:hypothetical protein